MAKFDRGGKIGVSARKHAVAAAIAVEFPQLALHLLSAIAREGCQIIVELAKGHQIDKETVMHEIAAITRPLCGAQ
ncbi:hypothetical protein D3C80_2118960 [compost metagenome]